MSSSRVNTINTSNVVIANRNLSQIQDFQKNNVVVSNQAPIYVNNPSVAVNKSIVQFGSRVN